jgi:hypothetical protein
MDLINVVRMMEHIKKTDTKLHFQQQVANVFSQAIRPVSFSPLHSLLTNVFSQAIRLVSFSPLHSLLTLYWILVRPKCEYASIAWNSLTCSDVCKLKRIQRQFVSLCHHSFFSHVDYNYSNVCSYLTGKYIPEVLGGVS